MKKIAFLLLLFSAFTACQEDEEDPFVGISEPREEYPGGRATVFDLSENAFGHAAPNLTDGRDLEFVTGNSFLEETGSRHLLLPLILMA